LRASAALALVEYLQAGHLASFSDDARAVWMLRKADASAALGMCDAFRDSGRHDAEEWNALLKERIYADVAEAAAQRYMDECMDRMNGVRITRPSLVNVICTW
jgi:hypothetical protein